VKIRESVNRFSGETRPSADSLILPALTGQRVKAGGANSQALLDDKDKQLIVMLQEDAELSLSAMGAKLGLTRMSVSNRIKRLKQFGVITGAHYRVDPQKVGQDYLVISQVACGVPRPEIEEVASKIAKIPGIQAVYLTFGQYDILFIARRKDKQSAKDLVYEISEIKGIRSTLTTIPHTVIKESLEVQLE
jgi:Lrp/AsnC family transcriptional regulator, leucine-responsive regulatory protein